MIHFEPTAGSKNPLINTMRGEFEAVLAGERRRFDTRLSTIAAIEAACGDRAVVDVLNGIIVGRRIADQLPLLAAALAAAEPACGDPDRVAASATVAEAEAFILVLIFALGFKVGEGGGAAKAPLGGPASGGSGAPSRSAL